MDDPRDLAALRAEMGRLNRQVEVLTGELRVRIAEVADWVRVGTFHQTENARLQAENERMTERNGKLEAVRDALDYTLPMAKGYAHAHQVGANQEKCNTATELLAACPPPEAEKGGNDG
jgi:hypothetical protein